MAFHAFIKGDETEIDDCRACEQYQDDSGPLDYLISGSMSHACYSTCCWVGRILSP